MPSSNANLARQSSAYSPKDDDVEGEEEDFFLVETPEAAEGMEELDEDAFPKTIFAIKTAIGHEKMVASAIARRAKRRGFPIYSILSPNKLRGFLLMEGIKNVDAIKDLIKGLQHVRNVVEGDTSIEDRCVRCKATVTPHDSECPECGVELTADTREKGIAHFLTPKPLVSGMSEGDIVEIINGPFKGEKARIQQIDESKEEIIIELFEAMVSIPVTLKGDHVRVLQSLSEQE